MQSIAFVPRLLDNFQSQQKRGKGAWEQRYADFATLVHVTSNSETVGVKDYGNIFSHVYVCVSWCIMLVTTVEKLMWVSGLVRCVSGEVSGWVSGEVSGVHVMNWTAASWADSVCSQTVFNLLNWNLILKIVFLCHIAMVAGQIWPMRWRGYSILAWHGKKVKFL